MTDELKMVIINSVKSQSGSIPEHLQKEFISLCRYLYNYNPNMSCGYCIFKYVKKLYDDKIKSN